MRYVLLVAWLAAAVAAQPLYQSDFAHGASGWSVQWTGSGKLSAGLDPAKPGPSGAPSWKTEVSQVTRGTVGVGLTVPAAHIWRVQLWGAARIEEGSVQLALQCWDAQNKQVGWLGIGSLRNNEQFQRLGSIVQVPDNAHHVNLLVLHQDMRGTSWIADVTVEPFRLGDNDRAALRPAGPTRWGTTTFFRSDDPLLRDTGAKLLVAAGVTHTRAGVSWSAMEPERGKYDFSALERTLADLARYGASADVVFIHGTPSWASGKTPDDVTPERKKQPWLSRRAFFAPRDWGDWERFVGALVKHFQGRVPAWEVLNEPDLWSEGFNGTYDEYKQYLTRAYRVAHEADPACKVLTAAFVFDEWLPRLLADKLGPCFDGVCVHPYNGEPGGCVARARRVQLLLVSEGAPKPIYVTEVGFQSGGWKEGPGVKHGEAEKAAAGRETLAGLAATSDVITWYTGIEAGNMYGLLRDDKDRYRPMPILFDYGQVTGRLTGNGPVSASVDGPERAAPGGEAAWRLVARNTSAQPVQVKFWPVGLVGSLGFTPDDLALVDWAGTLGPGQTHEVTVKLTPRAEAKGAYPVGLAVIAPQGNALTLRDVTVGG